MEPLAGSVTHLNFFPEGERGSEPLVFDLAHAQALAGALPSLREITLNWPDEITGAALVALVTQLPHLHELNLGVPCRPAGGVAMAAAAAQMQVQAGLRTVPLEIDLYGRWGRGEAQEAVRAVEGVLGSGVLGPVGVKVIAGGCQLAQASNQEGGASGDESSDDSSFYDEEEEVEEDDMVG